MLISLPRYREGVLGLSVRTSGNRYSKKQIDLKFNSPVTSGK
jgi:hypothetical protein